MGRWGTPALATVSTLLMLATLTAPASAQDAAAGQALYAPCTACHGAQGEGNKDLNAPAIAGQEYWYLVRQLQNFKNGVRGAKPGDTFGMQMAPMAQTLPTDADLQNVAAYVASLPPAPVTDVGGGDAAAGATVYATCAACHGPNAKGMESLNAPNLTLQQDWYLIRQLENFKNGIRGADAADTFGMQMAPMAQTVTDAAAMKNLAAYIATLRK